MSMLKKYRKGVGALLAAILLTCGTLVLADYDQANRARAELDKIEADEKRDSLEKKKRERLLAALQELLYDDAIETIRDIRFADVCASLGVSDCAIADEEKDIENNAQYSSLSFSQVRALILLAHQISSDIMNDNQTYALDELDKSVSFFNHDDAVLAHYSAIKLRSLRGEYPIALRHANALVAMFPDSAEAYAMRAGAWEGLDKDFGNLRGHFDRMGINIGEWRIDNGKEMAIKDLTSAIEIQDTLVRRIKRARLTAELFQFETAWADMKVAEGMATTDKDRERIRLSTWGLREREKEAKRIAAS